MTSKFGAKKCFAFIITILLLTDLAIFLNIIVLRQILGFFFLTILPGYLILLVLKLNKIEFTEKFVLSVGLSVSFLMFFGLLLNNSLLGLGYKTPLSTAPLLISLNLVAIASIFVAYQMNKTTVFSFPDFNLSTPEKAFLVIPTLFPALSMLGTHLMKTADNNIILMFLLFLIPLYVAFVGFFNQKFPKRLYPVVIFLISVSLLLIFMLRFPHICGHDVHEEYGSYFQTTFDNLHWSVFGHSALDACLSISILPTLFQSIMNVNAQEYLFKSVYVSICLFGPLAIYVIAKKYIDELYAFLASFLFMSQSTFLSVAGSARTNVAIFFVALTVMVFFSDKIDPLKRKILLIVFMFSIVISHYSTAYIFSFVLLFSWFATKIFSTKYIFKKNITLRLVMSLLIFIFFWYSQVTETAFDSGVHFVSSTVADLNNFFIEESRSTQFGNLVGEELTYPILSVAHLAVTWCIFILIGVGALTMLIRCKEMVVISNINLKKPDFLKTKFEMEYLVMALVSSGLLVAMVVLPHVSVGYGIQRVYSLAIVILSVCFFIGGMTLSEKKFRESLIINATPKLLLKKMGFTKRNYCQRNNEDNASRIRAYPIILLILIPYFMFQTGAMHQICGIPAAYTLNSEGDGYDIEYLHDQESCAAKWLKESVEDDFMIDAADFHGARKLISQGEFPRRRIYYKRFFKHLKIKGHIYLSYNNVVNDKLVVEEETYNISEYSDTFIDKNKIYDNSGSEIWK